MSYARSAAKDGPLKSSRSLNVSDFGRLSLLPSACGVAPRSTVASSLSLKLSPPRTPAFCADYSRGYPFSGLPSVSRKSASRSSLRFGIEAWPLIQSRSSAEAVSAGSLLGFAPLAFRLRGFERVEGRDGGYGVVRSPIRIDLVPRANAPPSAECVHDGRLGARCVTGGFLT